MSLVINTVSAQKRTVNLCWPKPDTRIPESQRPTPALKGKVECEFAYFSAEQSDLMDAAVECGDMTTAERFQKLVPSIKGLPLEGDETPYRWLERHEFGSIVQGAIYQEWLIFQGEAREGNSGKRRSR